MKPDKFSCSDGKGAVFRFYAGAGNNSLFMRGPRDEVGAKKDAKPSGGFSVIQTIGLISVKEGLEVERWRVANE